MRLSLYTMAKRENGVNDVCKSVYSTTVLHLPFHPNQIGNSRQSHYFPVTHQGSN